MAEVFRRRAHAHGRGCVSKTHSWPRWNRVDNTSCGCDGCDVSLARYASGVTLVIKVHQVSVICTLCLSGAVKTFAAVDEQPGMLKPNSKTRESIWIGLTAEAACGSDAQQAVERVSLVIVELVLFLEHVGIRRAVVDDHDAFVASELIENSTSQECRFHNAPLAEVEQSGQHELRMRWL